MAQVSEVMTENVIYLEADATVRAAMRVMHDADIRHVPVIDDGEVAGIVSDRDLREFTISIWDDADAVGRMREHMQRPISDFMNGDLHMVRPQDDLREAVDLMLEHKIGAVPVVEPATGELVGIISYIDVLRETRDAI